MDENQLHALLERLADSDPPPSRVGVDQIIRAARRRRWRLVGWAAVPALALIAAAMLLATSALNLSPSNRTDHHATRRSHPGPVSASHPIGWVPPGRYANAGKRYLRPGFVQQRLISSSAAKLVTQAPLGVARWTLEGRSCSVSYTMIKKTPWGNRGTGAGAGAAGCPWAPHLSLGARADLYSHGVLFSVIGGKVLPETGIRVRVTLADNAEMTVTPQHAMWLVIVQRCGGYDQTAIRSVEAINSGGSIIARQVPPTGHAPSGKPPC